MQTIPNVKPAQLDLEACDDVPNQRSSVVTPVLGALKENIFILRDREMQLRRM